MNIFTVSLFGHRELEDLRRIGKTLLPIIKELIRTKEYVSFLVGRNGEFDEYAASLIKKAQKEIGEDNNDMVLVLPYTVADIKYYERYYDSVVIPECVCDAHPKTAISLKNRWMVERSDLLIVYVEREKGGAYEAVKYAESLNKRIVNLYTISCEMDEDDF